MHLLAFWYSELKVITQISNRAKLTSIPDTKRMYFGDSGFIIKNKITAYIYFTSLKQPDNVRASELQKKIVTSITKTHNSFDGRKILFYQKSSRRKRPKQLLIMPASSC